jgi:hypothetical protein
VVGRISSSQDLVTADLVTAREQSFSELSFGKAQLQLRRNRPSRRGFSR